MFHATRKFSTHFARKTVLARAKLRGSAPRSVVFPRGVNKHLVPSVVSQNWVNVLGTGAIAQIVGQWRMPHRMRCCKEGCTLVAYICDNGNLLCLLSFSCFNNACPIFSAQIANVASIINIAPPIVSSTSATFSRKETLASQFMKVVWHKLHPKK